MIAFVIGNGRSREGIRLEDMAGHGKVFGCNAIYRDFMPYVLVSVDKGITQEISKNKIPELTAHYARHPVHAKSIKLDPKKHNSRGASGPVATKLAAIEPGIKKVYLVGVDLNSPDGKVNNIYAGTSNYRAVSGPAVKWHKWEKQYLEVFKQHPEIQFFRIMPMTQYVPSIWKGTKNIQHIEKEQFARELGFELGKVSYTATPAPNPPEESKPKRTPRPTPPRPVRVVQEKTNTKQRSKNANSVLPITSQIDKLELRNVKKYKVIFDQEPETRYFRMTFKENDNIVTQNLMLRTKFRGKNELAKEWTVKINDRLQSAKNDQELQSIFHEINNTITRRR